MLVYLKNHTVKKWLNDQQVSGSLVNLSSLSICSLCLHGLRVRVSAPCTYTASPGWWRSGELMSTEQEVSDTDTHKPVDLPKLSSLFCVSPPIHHSALPFRDRQWDAGGEGDEGSRCCKSPPPFTEESPQRREFSLSAASSFSLAALSTPSWGVGKSWKMRAGDGVGRGQSKQQSRLVWNAGNTFDVWTYLSKNLQCDLQK